MTHSQHMKQELTVIAVVGLLVLCGLGAGMLRWYDVQTAGSWWLAATALWALVVQQTAVRLSSNRRSPDSESYPDLGAANTISIARGWLIAATGGFLLVPAPAPLLIWLAAALYSVAAILDRIDGFVARRTDRSSLLGAELDTVFDALGLLVAPMLAVQLGKIHPVYLLVSVAYYLFVLGLTVRQRRGDPVYPLAPSQLRRTLAGFQMGYVAVVLWPPFEAGITVPAGVGFMLPLLAGFVVDWCVVSGRLRMEDDLTQRVFSTLERAVNTLLLPLLRVLITVMLVMGVLPLEGVLLLLEWSAALLIVCGILGRAGALMVLLMLAWTAPVLSPALYVLMYSTIAIVLLGCGHFSLWQDDDEWVNRQDGA